MTTLLFILAFLWVWFGITLHKLMQGVKIESFLKKLLYLVLVAPATVLEYMQSLSIRGTVGMWFARLGAWLQL